MGHGLSSLRLDGCGCGALLGDSHLRLRQSLLLGRPDGIDRRLLLSGGNHGVLLDFGLYLTAGRCRIDCLDTSSVELRGARLRGQGSITLSPNRRLSLLVHIGDASTGDLLRLDTLVGSSLVEASLPGCVSGGALLGLLIGLGVDGGDLGGGLLVDGLNLSGFALRCGDLSLAGGGIDLA